MNKLVERIKMNINLEKKRNDYGQLPSKLNSSKNTLDFATYYKLVFIETVYPV